MPRKHSTHACTGCAVAKRRCISMPSETNRVRCQNRKEICTFKPQKKRGPKPKRVGSPSVEETFSFNLNYKFLPDEAPISFEFQYEL
ncbi:hypothetical protein Glove_541g25 [Diversispora epigaea]|uniref:Zn(2)-C6 fungal-type domain-containing protein n=1 Tax=Diversispora epigaea TaxID=1348612 RepID=A0A397GCS6_9GLOM|nr:hypothetical protein Glove_541g25 [Diversispora epigaea]